jgi:hypothetical protein
MLSGADDLLAEPGAAANAWLALQPAAVSGAEPLE